MSKPVVMVQVFLISALEAKVRGSQVQGSHIHMISWRPIRVTQQSAQKIQNIYSNSFTYLLILRHQGSNQPGLMHPRQVYYTTELYTTPAPHSSLCKINANI